MFSALTGQKGSHCLATKLNRHDSIEQKEIAISNYCSIYSLLYYVLEVTKTSTVILPYTKWRTCIPCKATHYVSCYHLNIKVNE
jgi:hypothetical protein